MTYNFKLNTYCQFWTQSLPNLVKYQYVDVDLVAIYNCKEQDYRVPD